MEQQTLTRILEEREIGGKKYFVFPHLEALGVPNAVSTRDSHHKEEFVTALGFPWKKSTSPEQVHKDEVAVVTIQNAGKKRIPACDAMITDVPGVPLAIRTADCLAIILYDPVQKALGLVHAGWRGSFQKITEKTVRQMTQVYKTDPRYLMAAIGPSIGGCCYPVTGNVLGELRKSFSDWERYIYEENNETHLDLKALNRSQLLHTGIPTENVDVSLYCTSCMNDTFFSYRKEGIGAGRLITVAMLPPHNGGNTR